MPVAAGEGALARSDSITVWNRACGGGKVPKAPMGGRQDVGGESGRPRLR